MTDTAECCAVKYRTHGGDYIGEVLGDNERKSDVRASDAY